MEISMREHIFIILLLLVAVFLGGCSLEIGPVAENKNNLDIKNLTRVGNRVHFELNGRLVNVPPGLMEELSLFDDNHNGITTVGMSHDSINFKPNISYKEGEDIKKHGFYKTIIDYCNKAAGPTNPVFLNLAANSPHKDKLVREKLKRIWPDLLHKDWICIFYPHPSCFYTADGTGIPQSEDLKSDIRTMWGVAPMKEGNTWATATDEAVDASERVFNTLKLTGLSRKEVNDALMVDLRSEDYGYYEPFWSIMDPEQTFLVRIDNGRYGWQYEIVYDENDHVERVERQWIH